MLAALVAGMVAGLVTGLLHTVCGIPAILAGILTQLGLWSINMAIMGMKATVAINVTSREMLDKLLVSLRFVQDVAKGTRPFYRHPILVVGLFTLVIIALLYWFFGTELGCLPAGHRRQPEHGPCPGHQHQLHQGAGPDDLQRPGVPVRRAAGPVQQRQRDQHGPRRHRHRPGRRHHRRGGLLARCSTTLP